MLRNKTLWRQQCWSKYWDFFRALFHPWTTQKIFKFYCRHVIKESGNITSFAMCLFSSSSIIKPPKFIKNLWAFNIISVELAILSPTTSKMDTTLYMNRTKSFLCSVCCMYVVSYVVFFSQIEFPSLLENSSKLENESE